jgi:predicted hydrolase (HD superfamily)
MLRWTAKCRFAIVDLTFPGEAEVTPTRDDAWKLLTTYTKSESLLRHGLSVEAVMRHFARRYAEDEEKWGVIGLVHDLDWEMYPDQHCVKTEEFLREAGWPEEYIRAVLSHAWGFVTDVKPEHVMEKVLYATDELTGLVTATALMRPSRSVLDMKAKSVKKKWKEKSFAAGVDRGVIEAGAQMLAMELDELISETIAAMRAVAAEIGLEGEVSDDPVT